MGTAERSFIAKFSAWFVKNSRVTFLIFLGLIILGAASYTRFLTREGFPEVQIPFVAIQTPYFVNDVQKVDQDITSPIEKSISGIQEIAKTESITNENFSIVVVEFEEDVEVKKATRLLQEEIEKDAKLPQGAETEYQTFNAGALDGEHDLIFSISNDKPIKELQEKAASVAERLEKVDVVAKANVIELISKETNPITGEEFDYQTGFNRVGIKKGSEIEFSTALDVGVVKKGDAGLIELSAAVREEIDKLEKSGDLKGFEITYGGDFANLVNEEIDDLERNAINALIAVIAILFLLISWRASIVAAIFIPTVFSATLIGLYLIGYTLNVIVLFSLILILGLFVDDAIVVVEAIDYQKKQGLKGLRAIKEAIKDIGPADVAGTLTTVLVFLPMAFVSGLLGEFIELIPITVILSLILSILIGLSIIPFLSNIFIADKKEGARKRGLVKIFDFIINLILNGFSCVVNKLGFWVSRFVHFYLKNWLLAAMVFIAAIVWIAVGASYASKLTFAVFPPAKDGEAINVTLTFPNGIDIATAEKIALDAEKIILAKTKEHVEAVNYFMSSKESALINVELSPIESRTVTSREMVKNLRSDFEDFGETQVRVESEGVGPPTDEFQITLQILSDDESLLGTASEDVKSFLTARKIEGGGKVTKVALGDMANITKVNGKRFAAVKAKISDPNNTGMTLALQEDIEAKYNTDKLSSLGLGEDALGFDLGMEGMNIESFNSAIFALGVALILMYVLLVFQFNSFSQPLLIFLAIPFTFPALFPGVYLTDNSLGFFVMLGIIALTGIVVNNTIFLVDFANQARREGKGIVDSVTQAVRIRFRPIVATSATTIVALLPLTLTNPFWESLGFTIIFGLLSSSLMVIFAFPVFYAIVESVRSTRSRIWMKFTKANS